MRRLLPLTLVLAAALTAGCLKDPEAEAQRAQQLIELGDALNEVRLQMADQQGTLDSLRQVVARQDTALRQVAGMAGVNYR